LSNYLNIASDKNILFVWRLPKSKTFSFLTNLSLLLFKAKLIINFKRIKFTFWVYVYGEYYDEQMYTTVLNPLPLHTHAHTHAPTHTLFSLLFSLTHFVLFLSLVFSLNTHSLPLTHTLFSSLSNEHTVLTHTYFFSSFLLPWLNIHFKRVILSRSREGMLRLITKGVLIRCLPRFVTLKKKSFSQLTLINNVFVNVNQACQTQIH